MYTVGVVMTVVACPRGATKGVDTLLLSSIPLLLDLLILSADDEKQTDFR